MNRISLTEDELDMLESALIQHGQIVTFDQLSRFLDEDRQYTRTRISKLIRQGWLKRVKKGVYVIADLSSRGSLSISPLAIVNTFVDEAYVSFENSLQFHGMYDQLLNAVNSVSLKQYSSTSIDQTTYNFIKTRKRYFYGWGVHMIDGQSVKIAHAEKALIDLLQFHRTRYTTDLVLEKLRDFEDDIDQTRLTDCALQANLTARRILGFLMDIAQMETNRILDSVKSSQSVSAVSGSDHNLYNHKWRLYYDNYFERYVNASPDPATA